MDVTSSSDIAFGMAACEVVGFGDSSEDEDAAVDPELVDQFLRALGGNASRRARWASTLKGLAEDLGREAGCGDHRWTACQQKLHTLGV